ncbi:protein zer-1 homolog [Eriocheir sinensis]|uniref:protein zer-1 homolog n=1 Tax=Eriocheir sinensis TaxID=95602 RepID=UPI0021CAE159|nr:protein zer-1 homolog [Eriocheir sinensis]XP_050688967.1 protein zer-1 homolog [Eriocheir sinensis]XP_050688968.1 protein zer-1 homolog [Eriocheir sinensis]XP_050688969.1 protein zer-1 homolog [Eriocheir sinensis]
MSVGNINIHCPWEDNSPEPLLDICGKYVIGHPETFCVKHQYSGLWFLRPGTALPTELCEKLISLWQDKDPEALDDRFINIFRDLTNTRLKRVNLRNSSVSDDGLSVLLAHNLIELDISNCSKLSERTLDNINKYCDSLMTLVIGKTKDILPSSVLSWSHAESSNDFENSPIKEGKQRDYILRTPNLRKLVVRELIQPKHHEYFVMLLQPLTRLTHLDLSGCFFLHDIKYILPMKNLVSINLHNAQRIQDAIPVLSEIKTLKFLDVSQANQTYGMFECPNTTLANLVMSLPNLISLDISGTNLSGDGTFDEYRESDTKGRSRDRDSETDLCDIPGLRSRINNPLEFLGLYNTHHDACHRNHIPAKVITGDANEEQILAATAAYLDRPEVLVKALNELFHIFRFETCHYQQRALNLILLAMLRHRWEKHIQISGSASLFYIAKSEDKSSLSVRARQKMIVVLLDAMETHLNDSTMMRNGCLTLCQFRIPQDVLFEYRRLVQLLLRLIKGRGDGDDFVRRIAIYLLNSLACQVDGEQKELVGDLGAIETMLKLISDRLQSHVHDDMLEIAWSAMWNVTDETPVNCLRFLNGEGMTYFQKCLKEFPDKPELLRNMMGLLGNVAEVKDLRHRLMTPDLLTTFADLLDSNSDGIEVSYNAAGVLSHIASGGAEAWTIDRPTRAEVLERMVAAIERWDLASKRNINYRSFEPILRLLEVYHTPQCQHWAAWALANLTRVYPEKYCTLVEEEGGLQLLQALLASPTPYHRIKDLARTVIIQCQHYKEDGSLERMDLDSNS